MSDNVAPEIENPPFLGGNIACVVANSALRIYTFFQNHVYELALAEGGGWSVNDLSQITAGPFAADASAICCCLSSAPVASVRVYYFDAAGHVQELSLQYGPWVNNDLTAITSGPAARRGSGLACAAQMNGIVRVYYLDNNNHLEETALQTAGWSTNDLTAITGGPAARTGSGLACVVLPPGVGDSLVRVYYVDTSNHLEETALQSAGWSTNDLTAITSGPVAGTGSGLACAAQMNGIVRVYYLDNNNHLEETALQTAGWSTNDLTAITGGAAARTGSGLACAVLPPGDGDSSVRVYYIDTSNHLEETELVVGGTWSTNDLTKKTEGEPVGISNALACLVLIEYFANYIVAVYFWGQDGNLNQMLLDNWNWVQTQVPEVTFQQKINNVIVVMMENRSFDNLCGWLYADSKPAFILPKGSSAFYNGLNSSQWNPSNESYFQGAPPAKVEVIRGTSSSTVPDPDPEETFENVTYQLYGPQGFSDDPTWPTLGFLVNYENATSNANQIMETYTPGQTPVLSALARNYAISDAWFCSVPSQTWPNRSFVHAGTSNGNVNNGDYYPPSWDVRTIFNCLQDEGVSWAVYSDTENPGLESLTRVMFEQLYSADLDGNFRKIDDFETACANGALPKYSFIEPNFGAFDSSAQNDYHPPSHVNAGEWFLYRIWSAVSTSPAFKNTLLIITFDEHGGCYDHVLPPTGAATPDQQSDPGDDDFYFKRFGVRVPTLAISPYIRPGTVFRSNSDVPYDHTSVLATLGEWLRLATSEMPPSNRIVSAPTLVPILTLQIPRTDIPVIAPPAVLAVEPRLNAPLNDLQRSIIAAMAFRAGLDPVAVLTEVKTSEDAARFSTSLANHPKG